MLNAQAPASTSLNDLLVRWEAFVSILAHGWMSPGAYCSDLCCRDEIAQLLTQRLADPVMGESAMSQDVEQRLATADAIFCRETEQRSTCVIDAWQDRLTERGQPAWLNWTKHQTNFESQWYFYRWML